MERVRHGRRGGRRRKKVYYPRVNPMTRYEDNKFIARYRVSKDVVRKLAQEFGNSGLCSTSSRRGGALSVEERVSITLIIP